MSGTAEIKAGDVVILKSGGPKMTVLSIKPAGPEQSAECAWFGAQTEKVFVQSFALIALRRVNE
jgi:uncharacterized protein YodC (DUF2158 family)